MNQVARQCASVKGCVNQTKDPSGRCHHHRDEVAGVAGKPAAGLAGATGNLVAQQGEKSKRQKGRPTMTLTEEEKAFFELMKVGASFRAPYFRRSINTFPVASHPGLGTMAMGKNGIVYIDFDWASALPEARTLADGTLETPEQQKTRAMEKASAILIHEASHFNLDHFGRADMVTTNKQHARLMNIAGDMEINQGLVKRGHRETNVSWKQSILKEEYQAVYPWSDQFKLDPDQPFEVYLRQLIKKQKEEEDKKKDEDKGDKGDKGDDQGDGGDGGDDGEGDEDGEGEGSGQGKPGMGGKPASGNGGGEEGDGEPTMCGGGSAAGTPLEDELMGDKEGGMSEADVDNLRRDTAGDIVDHEKQYGQGSVPGEVLRNAEEILKGTRIDWKKEMRSAISKSVRTVRGRTHYDTKQRNRRLTNASTYIFPGTVTPTPNISVAIDTSGSMGREELGLALGQIQSILNQAGSKSRIDFIAVDAAASEPRQIKKVSDIELSGGGGTDMGVAIRDFASRKKHRPDVGIIVTDGGTPWPSEQPKGMDIIVAIVGQGANEKEYGGQMPPEWAKTVFISQVV